MTYFIISVMNDLCHLSEAQMTRKDKNTTQQGLQVEFAENV